MSVSFNGSTQYIINSTPPFTGYPFTAAAWCKPRSLATAQPNGYVVFGRNIGSSDSYGFYRSGAQWGHYGGNLATLFGTVVADRWYFLIWRVISITNRRMTVLDAQGTITHSQATDSGAALVATSFSLGAGFFSGAILNPFDGEIEQFSMWNVDIQPDGLQLNSWLLWQLAYGGPHALPHQLPNLITYRALRAGPFYEGPRDSYYGRGRQTWGPVADPTLGPFAPQPASFWKPGNQPTIMVPV